MKALKLAAAVAAGALLLVACGDDDGGGSADTTAASSETTAGGAATTGAQADGDCASEDFFCIGLVTDVGPPRSASSASSERSRSASERTW